MGVTVRQKDGAWYVFINHRGKRKAKRIGSDKKTAQQVARKIEAGLVLGELTLLDDKSKAPTLRVYAERWMGTYARLHCKESTRERYRINLDCHLYPTLGDIPLSDISREQIKNLLYRKAEVLSRRSVQNFFTTLHTILNHAVDDELIPSNPAARLGRFIAGKPQSEDERIHALTREELAVLLDAMSGHYPKYYPLFLCLARTGMRIGEARGLQWGDVNFEQRYIMVRRTMSGGRVTTPKNGKTRRVDMSRQLHDVLYHLRTQGKEEALRKGWGQPPVWVFHTETGQPLDGSNLRKRVFLPALKQARLPTIRIHDLRHTYASLLIEQGESLVYIRDQLGHHDISMTVDTYGHLVPGGNTGAVDRLDDASKRNTYATEYQDSTL